VKTARYLPVIRLLHTSTSETYQTVQFLQITEAHSLKSQSPYVASKFDIDCEHKSLSIIQAIGRFLCRVLKAAIENSVKILKQSYNYFRTKKAITILYHKQSIPGLPLS